MPRIRAVRLSSLVLHEASNVARRTSSAYARRVVTSPRLATLTVCLATGLSSSPASPHHSWSAHYDLSRSTFISGTVARVSFRYPHSALVLNVDAANGRAERWTVEWASPQRLRERGVTERTVRIGDALLVTGNPHRDPKVRSLRVESLRRAADGEELGRD